MVKAEFPRGYVRVPKRLSGASGATQVKSTLARELRRAMTPAETALWAAARRNGLGAPCRRQHVIRGWIVDFFVPAASLVIELDGDVHRESQAADSERDEVMRSLSLEVIRIQNDEVTTGLTSVVERLRTAVQERLASSRSFPLSSSAGEGPGEGS